MTPPDGKITPLRGFIEDPDGGTMREVDLGLSYSIDVELYDLMTPRQRKAYAAQQGTQDVRGGDEGPPL